MNPAPGNFYVPRKNLTVADFFEIASAIQAALNELPGANRQYKVEVLNRLDGGFVVTQHPGYDEIPQEKNNTCLAIRLNLRWTDEVLPPRLPRKLDTDTRVCWPRAKNALAKISIEDNANRKTIPYLWTHEEKEAVLATLLRFFQRIKNKT